MTICFQSRRRLLWLIVILISLTLYFPINHIARGGTELLLPIDKNVPFFPSAIVPYLFGSLLFFGLPIWAAIYVKRGEFETYVISILLGTAVSYFIYIVFPTFVTRPDVTSTDIFSKAIVILYQTDRAYNAAPSGHALYTTLSFLYLSRWKPRFKPIWFAIAGLILLSTLLTKQHHLLDLVSGLSLGVLVYWVGLFAGKKWDLEFASSKKSRTQERNSRGFTKLRLGRS